MKIVDLSHLMNVHTPGWVGYAGNQMYYAQNLQTKMIVAQRIDTALHVGTHIDGAMSYALDFLVGPGAVIDVSRHMDDWAVITPEMIEAAPVEVREGDILIIHTCTATGKGSRARISYAISACTPAARSNCLNGCSRRRSSGLGSTAAPPTTR